MAGGTFSAYNKVLPGVYINIKSTQGIGYAVGQRGIVTIAQQLSWGDEESIIKINAGDDVTELLGYDADTAQQLQFLQQLFLGTNRTSGASQVLLWRFKAQNAAKATAVLGQDGVTATARCTGVRGNTIAVSVTENPDGGFFVDTLLDGITVDTQTVASAQDLQPNAWVVFGQGTLTACAAVMLTGGADGTVDSSAWSKYLSAIEPYTFDVLICDATDQTVHAAVTTFIKRLRDAQGRKCQAVLADYTADSEGIINVCNGYITAQGTITPAQATHWVGGAAAGAEYTQSLSYATHPQAIDVFPRLTISQQEEALRAGKFVFFEDQGQVKILSDINSLTSFTNDKNRAFCKNRVVRTLDTLANSLTQALSNYQIGSLDNDSFGRNMLKKEVVALCNEMVSARGLRDFTADDVTVEAGAQPDTVIVTLAVSPVDAVEKIYITATVA